MHTPHIIQRKRVAINKALSNLQRSCGDHIGHDFIFTGAEVIPRRALNSGEKPTFFMSFRCEHCGLELSSKVTQFIGGYVSHRDLGHHCEQILARFQKDAQEHANFMLHPFQSAVGYGISVEFPDEVPRGKGEAWLKKAVKRLQESRRQELAARHADELARV